MKLMELFESLNTILPHKIIENTNERKQYGINCKGTLFMLVFDLLTPKHAIVSFYEQTESNNIEYGITNNNVYPGQLFATIIKIIGDEIKHLDMIAYTASGNSRKRLYTTLAKKYSSNWIVYNIPINDIQITIISRYKLTSEEKTQIVTTAENLLNEK